MPMCSTIWADVMRIAFIMHHYPVMMEVRPVTEPVVGPVLQPVIYCTEMYPGMRVTESSWTLTPVTKRKDK